MCWGNCIEVDSGNSNLWLSCLESDGFGDDGVECGGGGGGGDERSQHRHMQQKHDKHVAEGCEFQFKVLHKAEGGGPPQFKGEWSKGPDCTIDAFIYFRSTLAGGFKVGDVVAGHKVGLPNSELCTPVRARSQFPWVQHWMSGVGACWPCKRVSFWIADGKGCKDKWADPAIASVKALVDSTIELMEPELGGGFGGPNLAAQVHFYRHRGHIRMHRDSSRKSTLGNEMSTVHIYVSG